MVNKQVAKVGGLGANIGTEEWQKARKKQEQIKEYTRQLQYQSLLKPPTQKKEISDQLNLSNSNQSESAYDLNRNIPRIKVK